MTARGVADFVYEALPGRVVFGAGRRAEISAEVDRLGARRAFLIADGAAAATGDELAANLADRLAGRWDEVVQHVPSELADRARAAAADALADVVVCVGGGSSTGLAKAIALTSRLPVIAVPTTYAGSEQTPIYGLTGDRHKQTGRDVAVLPKAVIYDPELTVGLPPGRDRAQRVQRPRPQRRGAVGAGGQPGHDGAGPRRGAGDRRRPPGRDGGAGRPRRQVGLLYGAYLSGVALATTSAGMHHKITHVLGGTFGLVHADTHSVILPHVVAFNGQAVPAAMARLADALGAPGDDAAGALWDLAEASGVPTSLAALGLARDDLRRPPSGPPPRSPPTRVRSRLPTCSTCCTAPTTASGRRSPSIAAAS